MLRGNLKHIDGVLRVFEPSVADAIPLLVDSPHSGRDYPADFGYACHIGALQRYEDRFVDLLAANFPRLGAVLVQAEAPRTYIDLNRATDDVAANQMIDVWGGHVLRPGPNALRGTGLIWTRAWDVAIYEELPSAANVQARIERYYRPYYETLEAQAERIMKRFGRVYHINLHSMPPTINQGKSDVVLGDLEGRSCSPAFLAHVADLFKTHGLRVAINTPYKGAELTRHFGRPDRACESLQVELSKALYMHDDLLTLHDAKFLKLQAILDDLVREIGVYSKTSSKVA